jgi:F-type H+-transporting ATPase subunit gamma
MASIRDLRTRIKSVGSIKQITRAMEMVAATKLRRFQSRAVTSRPFSQEIVGLLERLARSLGERLVEHPLFQRGGEGLPTAVVLVSSDRGLCGAYNSNVFRELERWVAGRDAQRLEFFVFGRKGQKYVQKRGWKVARMIADPPLEKVDYRSAKQMAKAIQERPGGKARFDEVWMLHTAYDSPVRFVPTWSKLLPIEFPAQAGEKAAPAGDVIVEPSVDELIEHLIPRFLEARLYNALLESVASEYAMRRISMKNATDAATEMQGLLRKIYNRKRQENITKELLDIVGGVEALR